MINRYFNNTWMKGRVQPCTDLGFSLLDPFYTLHSSVDKNFSCQSLLTLSLCALLSLYLGILYPPRLPFPPRLSSPSLQRCDWPQWLAQGILLFGSCVPRKRSCFGESICFAFAGLPNIFGAGTPSCFSISPSWRCQSWLELYDSSPSLPVSPRAHSFPSPHTPKTKPYNYFSLGLWLS